MATSLPLLSAFSLAVLAKPAAELALLTIQSQPMTQYVYLDGRLEAVNQSTISAQTSGIVESIHVDINDQVSAGQTLITINNSQQSANLSQAQANLAQAQAINEDGQILLQRNRSLFAKKTLSQGELDRSIAQAKSSAAAVLAAQAKVKQAQEQLSYTQVLAPYAGIVSQRSVQIGELVSPGQTLMSGFAPQPLRVVSQIPQHLVAKFKRADNSAITISAEGKNYSIESYTLFPYADSRYSSTQARITLAPLTEQHDTRSLIPGSWVSVALAIGQKNSIVVPKSTIIQQGEIASLYVIETETRNIKLRFVRLGSAILETQEIEILSGLNSGETIVINAIAGAIQASKQQVSKQQASKQQASKQPATGQKESEQ